MEFIQYLSPAHMRVYELSAQVVSIKEDTAACKKYGSFGFFNAPKRELSMCTTKIKSFDRLNVGRNIEATLLHEATHVAQACKERFKWLKPLGMDPSKLKLSWQQEQDMKKVMAFNPNLKFIDREAFWMENKPNQAAYVIKKYCNLK